MSRRIPFAELSWRQQQVLTALLEGLSEKEVALRLRISVHTVHMHVKALYRICEVNSRAGLMSLWVDQKSEHAGAETRGQRSEVSDQKSDIKDQKSEVRRSNI